MVLHAKFPSPTCKLTAVLQKGFQGLQLTALQELMRSRASLTCAYESKQAGHQAHCHIPNDRREWHKCQEVTMYMLQEPASLHAKLDLLACRYHLLLICVL